MLNSNIQKHGRANGFLLALFFAFASVATAVGCGSTKNPTPDGGGAGTGGAGTTGAAGVTGGAGTTGAGGATGAGGTTGAAGTSAQTDGGTDGGDGGGTDGPTTDGGNPDTAVVGYPGCFQGTPADRQAGSLQFLNKCTGTNCFHFDNAARLPRYTNGTLPPLQ